MREHRPSDTAEGVCLFRAWEQYRPAAQRIVDDPYAEPFLSARGRAGLAVLRAMGPGADLADRALTGLATYALARHACFDHWLTLALEAARVDQVVLLGAGYDSRAWRLASLLGDRPIYELDHPATGARKTQLVAEHAGEWPTAPRTAVAVDLAAEPFEPALRLAGWTPDRPTFWIWEGVSMYLLPEDTRATLSALRQASAPGSQIAVDFWALPVGWHPRAALTRMAAATFAALGEPVRGSFPQAVARDLLADVGLDISEVAEARDLAQRFVPGKRTVLPDCWCALLQSPA